MKNYFSHPKTTIAGLAAIFAVVGKVVATGHIDFGTDIAAVTAAIGLICASDGTTAPVAR